MGFRFRCQLRRLCHCHLVGGRLRLGTWTLMLMLRLLLLLLLRLLLLLTASLLAVFSVLPPLQLPPVLHVVVLVVPLLLALSVRVLLAG